jgi:hypothetical protein
MEPGARQQVREGRYEWLIASSDLLLHEIEIVRFLPRPGNLASTPFLVLE